MSEQTNTLAFILVAWTIFYFIAKQMKLDESDLKLLELFANDAAIAISRSTLNEKLKNFNERLKRKIKDATAELSLKNNHE